MRRIACLWIAFGSLAAFGQDSVRALSILHSNDLHAQLSPNPDGSGGFAYLATAVRHEREGCTTCIYLSAGDMVQGTPVSTVYRGEPIYRIANLLGFDAGTLGNHEFDAGSRGVARYQHIAHFPLVSANVVTAAGQPATGKAYVILNVGGLRVGIIGAAMGDLVGGHITAEDLAPWHVTPVVETMRRTAREIRPRADLVIALMHVDEVEAAAVLAEAPEIDVLILGHVHEGYTEIKQNGHRYAVEGKAYGAELGRLDLRFDTAKREIVSAEWKRISIDSRTLAPAPDVQREIAKWEAKVAPVVDVPIGEARRAIPREELVQMLDQAMAEATGADFGFATTGEVPKPLAAGPLKIRQIWEVMPYDNRVVTGRFKGSDLPAKLAEGHAIDPQREYRVVMSAFDSETQATSLGLPAGQPPLKFGPPGPIQRDLMVNWVRKKKVLE